MAHLESHEPLHAPAADELRLLYREEAQAKRRKEARPGLWMAVVIYVLFSVSDLLLIPDVAAYSITARFAVGLTALLVLEEQLRRGAATQWLDLTCAAAIIFGYIGWLGPTSQGAEREAVAYYMVFGTIFMMSANLFFTFSFRTSIITSTIILCILYVVNYFVPASLTYKLVFGAFYISCFTFTSYVNWKLNEERYNVFLNALEAKIQHNEATERGKALLRLSRTDPLTGLENRRAIDEKLREHWSDWQKLGIRFAAILIDVDFFKKFNDCYGHQEGDRCLIHVANALSELVTRYNGSIGRYGGEEFIMLARLNDKEQVADLAQAICRTVEELALTHELRRDGTSIVTVSVGAAFTRTQAGAKLEKIIHEADRALYLAKAGGRNCARLFDPTDPQSSDESENIAALLKIAIDRNLVSLVYQPIQDIASGRIEAVEALMRLKMLDGILVPPSLFIPVAERTGAILELGRWAIRTVCTELLAHDHVRVVSVNVSPIQLKTPGFATSVASILGETGVAGSKLAFEITEGRELEMDSDILRCISDLKLLGIRIWLDDFGTGFAGLSWLRLIDFDTVKIDRSFLHDCGTPKGMAMLQDIIALVRNRGHKILVEGVENEEQMELMREFGIDKVQGYHVARPMPAASFQAKRPVQKRPFTVLKSA
ncbi:EAL domain-containing protein [Mesorhizobium sp. CU2]|uniref:putative bifunctional diguanylate cyclase/phosphodiesterase n=1 Tax=unclassified Mesorhizobium TaxID=325217 RepID=UPI001125FF7B|nr:MULTISPECIES: EAL domain-containing protein [unclassified Mesorhizobium]TPN84913.1 EAL domain-containing protein [Mesorhizobium sp. CU3]TPO14985.1 EAL domain-containing protein [Mesorhizobium sp. CU2]